MTATSEADTITLDCPTCHGDCTVDCGRCGGRGIVKVPISERSVAHAVAADFNAYERHEWPSWPSEGEGRDRELVAWTLRCLANPSNGWSVTALAAIVEKAESRTADSSGLDPFNGSAPVSDDSASGRGSSATGGTS